MKKTIAALALIGAGLVNGQDFFNGMPGPSEVQLDSYINMNTETKKASGMFIPKIFFGNFDKGYENILTAIPICINNKGEADVKGINVGTYNTLHSDSDVTVSAVAATGMFKGSENTLDILSPQLYVTGVAKGLSADLEGSMAFNLRDGSKNESAALLLGYGNNMIRAGASVKVQNGQKPSYQGVVRIDLTKDHKYWAEGYVSKDNLGVRFAYNP